MESSGSGHKAPDVAAQLERDPPQLHVFDEFVGQTDGQWTCLYRSRGAIGSDETSGWYSCLMPRRLLPKALTSSSWDLVYDSGRPGFMVSHSAGRKRTEYLRTGTSGIEALVHVRFIPGRETQIDVSEEFRFLFQLFERRPDRTLYYTDDLGNDLDAIRVTDNEVLARTSLVRRYQAARQLCLGLFIDSTVSDQPHLKDLPDTDWEIATDNSRLTYYLRDLHAPGAGRFSRLLGKRFLLPPRRSQCAVWPFEETKQYERFIIAIDDLGRPIENTSNPNKLANYFGANAGKPQYVTPVFFRREVLGKYYQQPQRYGIQDGYVRCEGFWGMGIDNDAGDYVVAFLGDLGRDLPHGEQLYWKSFNVPPAGPMSETAIRRSFLGQWADASSADLQFKKRYGRASQAWEAVFKWPLFKPMHEDDAHVLKQLRKPLTDDQAEFDEQILHLAKLLVDSLNEEALAAAVGPGDKDEKGITKLDRFLEQHHAAERLAILAPLRTIQAIRSSGGAHRKGTKFDRVRSGAPVDRRAWFQALLEDAIVTLRLLSEFAQSAGRTGQTAEGIDR